MHNLFHMALRATDTQHNIDREYVLCLGKNLFGDWVVTSTFGRYKTKGTTKRAAFTTRQEACSYLVSKLKKRLSAPKRIGCAYHLTNLEGKHDALEWIDNRVIGLFEKGSHPSL